MTVSATDVNKLRQHTGAGMMDCKKALEESNGDFDEAVSYLRKKGAKVSSKRADKEANEGRVEALTTEDRKTGVIIAANCETDFVAKNDDFTHFVKQAAQAALDHKPNDVEALKSATVDGTTVSTMLEDQMAKIGEKITLSTYHLLEGEYVEGYNHFGNQIGVLVAFNKSGDHIVQPAQDIAMQIAAMGAMAVDRDGIPEDAVNQELEVAKEQIRQEGKPDHLVDKIAQGKLNKFYKENTLLEQEFVKDSEKTVKDFLAEVDSDLKITDFRRIAIGGNG
jgi:elongation factor Ts